MVSDEIDDGFREGLLADELCTVEWMKLVVGQLMCVANVVQPGRRDQDVFCCRV
ncbi:Uncharacterised protein [Mycobacteroides abscessus subsp. abscessus]|nr:Uncharacterised protein [Mycobacteroides abscessus subsp. abscessus]SHX83367.1 Uncharacterised protein [Mycobacteroides abscessus subsp. abscessus]